MKKQILTFCALAMGAFMLQSCDLFGWEDGHIVDKRISNVVPDDVRDKMEDYMPIYDGILPPVVEGTYIVEPMTAVFCEDYESGFGYAPGTEMTYPHYLEFSNQNRLRNTIDMRGVEGTSTQSGEGSFISGSGNNFTIFFNTTGQSYGVDVKTALVISGTKTDLGIADLYYAFVMVEKGDDPDHEVMDEGIFRVFNDGDGLSENSTWPASVRVLEAGQLKAITTTGKR